MNFRSLTISAAVLAALTAIPSTAAAGPPGQWTQVTGFAGQGRNTDELGRARTADGVLHLAWQEELAGNAARLAHTAIPANGKGVSPAGTIASYTGGANNAAALLPAPGGGLRAFFAGQTPGSPLSGLLATATSANGNSWSQPTPASSVGNPRPVYAAQGIDAVAIGGSFASVWGDSAPGTGAMHLGLDGGTPDVPLGGACCKIDPGLAVDSKTGQVVLGYNDTATDRVVLRRVAPAGPDQVLPASAAGQLQTRVKVTGRQGAGGVYAAYSTGTNQFLGRPALIALGSGKALVASGKRGAQDTGVASAPQGRLWIYYHRAGRIYAARTNRAATRFGAAAAITAPGRGTVSTLDGEGSRGPLDVLANVTGGGKVAFHHQRVLPGLTLSAKKGKKGKVTFKVTDAGDPVGGAKVRLKLKGKTLSATTSKKGVAKVTVPADLRSGRRTATGTRKDYRKATTKVKLASPRAGP